MSEIWEAPELNDLEVLDAEVLCKIQARLEDCFQALALIRRGIDPRVCGWPWRKV